jgi:hypothetical protein
MFMNEIITKATIYEKILQVRGMAVMIDRELAEIYGVEIREFNQAVSAILKGFLTLFGSSLQNQKQKT